MYTLLVCADLFGDKINLEVIFPAMPTIGELQRKVGDAFNGEAQLKRPQGYPSVEFTVARLQIYDDVLLKWADLVTCSQLHEYDQLYAFQPQSPWHIDVQKDLPPPRPPTNVTAGPAIAAPSQPALGATPPSAYAAPPPQIPAHASPAHDRLSQNTQRADALRAELARIDEENARLAAQRAAEEEQQRRAQQEAAARALTEKEAAIRAQREQLERMEAEYRAVAQSQYNR